MRRAILAWLSLVCLAAGLPAQQGKLQRVRNAVNDSDDADASSNQDDADRTSSDDDDSSESFLGELLGAFVSSLLQSDEGEDGASGGTLARVGFFPRHPYEYDRAGYLRFERLEEGQPGRLRRWSGRFEIDNGNDFDGLNRTGARLFLDSSSRFGLQARYDFFSERLSCGCLDQLHLGSTELTYRLCQGEHAQMYLGAGLRVLDDRASTHYGVNFTGGIDVFPARPFVLSLAVDGGTVGDAELFRTRGTVGVLYRGFEAFTGYDYLNIGGVELQGLLFGVRLWF